MLSIGDAAAAILIYEDGRILMQLRDDRPDIWYPDHWGLFGGGVEAGETPEEALCRELYEELELVKLPGKLFAQFAFDLSPIGLGKADRSYFEVHIDSVDINRIRIHEGKEARLFEAKQIFSEIRVTPYDAFALQLFIDQNNLLQA
jgi:8-oxo-dGTP pyrophosphatase MutT (NUDIX family)